MKTIPTIVALIVLASYSASAQKSAAQDPLLDRMTGNWLLQGTIGGRETTHDIESDWVLNHEYVRIHETSREKNAQGQAMYEAVVFIEWNESSSEYACLWLDSTEGGGLSSQVIGRGKRSGDEIALLFKTKSGNFRTTFAYGKGTDTWQWFMDDEQSGKLVPFARVKLVRK